MPAGCKPGSVLVSHLSRLAVAGKLERFNDSSGGPPIFGLSPCSRQGLPLPCVTVRNCGPLPQSLAVKPLKIALTKRSGHSFHHFLASGNETGCVVSVALSLGLLPVAVSNCLCPMLPGLSSRANARATDHQPAPLDYTLFSSSRTRLSSASANLFSALRTCMNLMDLKFGIIS